MAEVYNWQLGRKMDYRFADAPPQWQFAFVFNINRCIACQTCTMACKSTWTFSKGQEYMWWNNVETKPYGGYPQHWDAKILSMLEQANPGKQMWNKSSGNGSQKPYGEFGGMTIFEAAQKNFSLDGHQVALGYIPTEDGIVLIDQNRCRGYRKCVEACPYKKPMFRGTTRVSEKCVGCYPRIEGTDPLTEGQPMETRCMAACVGQIRLQGLVGINEDGSWAEDRYNPLYYLIKVEKVALPLYPQFGTEPNGYYIPP